MERTRERPQPPELELAGPREKDNLDLVHEIEHDLERGAHAVRLGHGRVDVELLDAPREVGSGSKRADDELERSVVVVVPVADAGDDLVVEDGLGDGAPLAADEGEGAQGRVAGAVGPPQRPGLDGVPYDVLEELEWEGRDAHGGPGRGGRGRGRVEVMRMQVRGETWREGAWSAAVRLYRRLGWRASY